MPDGRPVDVALLTFITLLYGLRLATHVPRHLDRGNEKEAAQFIWLHVPAPFSYTVLTTRIGSGM
jgi:hypothetical protein